MAAIELAQALALLLADEAVAIPTETVYGLAANARSAAAIARIYALKGRPSTHPVIVHVTGADALGRWASHVPPAALALATAFWPGPLTLVLPRAPAVLDAVTGGQDTVALRCPDHPLALALLEACALQGIDGLAAPSANRFGHVSPTTRAHVEAEFGADFPVMDGGACRVGIESTIVDLSGAAPRILRPGMLDRATLAEILHLAPQAAAKDAPRVSGSLAAHYAPATALQLVPPESLPARAAACIEQGLKIAVLARISREQSQDATPKARWWSLPGEPAAYAQVLYARLREADALAQDLILVEALPETVDWAGPRDRLARAAHGAGRRTFSSSNDRH